MTSPVGRLVRCVVAWHYLGGTSSGAGICEGKEINPSSDLAYNTIQLSHTKAIAQFEANMKIATAKIIDSQLKTKREAAAATVKTKGTVKTEATAKTEGTVKPGATFPTPDRPSKPKASKPKAGVAKADEEEAEEDEEEPKAGEDMPSLSLSANWIGKATAAPGLQRGTNCCLPSRTMVIRTTLTATPILFPRS